MCCDPALTGGVQVPPRHVGMLINVDLHRENLHRTDVHRANLGGVNLSCISPSDLKP